MTTSKSGDFLVDSYPPATIVTATTPRWDFMASQRDVITLIRIHDEQTGGAKGRPPQDLEALKRSALILAVTAWESFVEDTVEEGLTKALDAATVPTDLQSAFNYVAEEWLDPERSGKRHGPDLIKWTGDQWKLRIRESLATELQTFHTPNSDNTNKLFKRFLGVPIRDGWHWKAMNAKQAQTKLDALIKLRGSAVHQGKTLFTKQKSPTIKRAAVVDAMNHLYRLVCASEKTLGVGPTTK